MKDFLGGSPEGIPGGTPWGDPQEGSTGGSPAGIPRGGSFGGTPWWVSRGNPGGIHRRIPLGIPWGFPWGDPWGGYGGGIPWGDSEGGSPGGIPWGPRGVPPRGPPRGSDSIRSGGGLITENKIQGFLFDASPKTKYKVFYLTHHRKQNPRFSI